MSTNIFELADGHPTLATTINMLDHKVREPARNINMVPELANQYLPRGGKSIEAGYVSVRDGQEVSISDGHTTKITVSGVHPTQEWWETHSLKKTYVHQYF